MVVGAPVTREDLSPSQPVFQTVLHHTMNSNRQADPAEVKKYIWPLGTSRAKKQSFSCHQRCRTQTAFGSGENIAVGEVQPGLPSLYAPGCDGALTFVVRGRSSPKKRECARSLQVLEFRFFIYGMIDPPVTRLHAAKISRACSGDAGGRVGPKHLMHEYGIPRHAARPRRSFRAFQVGERLKTASARLADFSVSLTWNDTNAYACLIFFTFSLNRPIYSMALLRSCSTSGTLGAAWQRRVSSRHLFEQVE